MLESPVSVREVSAQGTSTIKVNKVRSAYVSKEVRVSLQYTGRGLRAGIVPDPPHENWEWSQ